MFDLVLYQPEIPPNTGNIIRLCANIGANLHLIEPLGFIMDDKRLRRAGLDYAEWVNVRLHRNFTSFIEAVNPPRVFACSTHGKKYHSDIQYQAGDAFLMGPETRGLPPEIRQSDQVSDVIRIPMLPDNRSINLSNATAIIVYEAWRQLGFEGAV